MAFGDSITEGVRDGVAREQIFTSLVEASLRAQGIDVEVVNAGVGGEESGEALERFESDVLDREPDVVTIMYGTNDSFVDEGEQRERIDGVSFRRNLATMVDRALAAGIRPLLMTEPRWGPLAVNGLRENPNARLEAYMEQVRALASERNVPLVDHLADWTSAGKAGTDGTWTVDQCHPNADGHRRMADLLTPVLLQELVASKTGLPPEVVVSRNLDYGASGDPMQMLDVYRPRTPSSAMLPLVVFLHGGGWNEGDKADLVGMMTPLVASGDFAGASVNYRLTGLHPHPAQIHDVKGALRWLRAHVGDYGIDPARIALFGVSAGGHLASLAGTATGIPELEGVVGGNAGQPSDVACVVNFCGPSSFLTFSRGTSRVDPEDSASIVARLLGGPPSQRPDVARAASPITHVSAHDPPFLHVHGSDDDVVPVSQTRELDAALDASGVPSTVLIGEGAGHLFWSPELKDRIRTFLRHCLLGEPAEVSEGTVAIR